MDLIVIVKEGEELAGATRACWEGKSAPVSFAGGSEEQQIRPFSREQQNMLLLFRLVLLFPLMLLQLMQLLKLNKWIPVLNKH